jgi:hypothetical protein
MRVGLRALALNSLPPIQSQRCLKSSLWRPLRCSQLPLTNNTEDHLPEICTISFVGIGVRVCICRTEECLLISLPPSLKVNGTPDSSADVEGLLQTCGLHSILEFIRKYETAEFRHTLPPEMVGSFQLHRTSPQHWRMQPTGEERIDQG